MHESEYLAYSTALYQAFNWNPLSYSSLPMSETYGLDYESACKATPHWFGVSFGDGNNGVSHAFPLYYVRTSEPFKLAKAAVVAGFKPEWKAAAADACEIEGEAAYTITATIYDERDVEGYPDDDDECESGPAWLICEVFPVNDMPPVMVIGDDGGLEIESDPFGTPAYMSLADALDEADLALAD